MRGDICQYRERGIYPIKYIIENPTEFKEYKIEYKNKEYSLIFEVVFGLLIDEFKKNIEKDFIIKETYIEIETNDSF